MTNIVLFKIVSHCKNIRKLGVWEFLRIHIYVNGIEVHFCIGIWTKIGWDCISRWGLWGPSRREILEGKLIAVVLGKRERVEEERINLCNKGSFYIIFERNFWSLIILKIFIRTFKKKFWLSHCLMYMNNVFKLFIICTLDCCHCAQLNAALNYLHLF